LITEAQINTCDLASGRSPISKFNLLAFHFLIKKMLLFPFSCFSRKNKAHKSHKYYI